MLQVEGLIEEKRRLSKGTFEPTGGSSLVGFDRTEKRFKQGYVCVSWRKFLCWSC